VNRTLIVARLKPGARDEVARVFARSDASPLPRDLGVSERSLYALGDLYVHVIDFDRDSAEAMARAAQHPGFGEICTELHPHITPFSPTWRSPRDAMADRFYHWKSEEL
jgi:cyclase